MGHWRGGTRELWRGGGGGGGIGGGGLGGAHVWLGSSWGRWSRVILNAGPPLNSILPIRSLLALCYSFHIICDGKHPPNFTVWE